MEAPVDAMIACRRRSDKSRESGCNRYRKYIYVSVIRAVVPERVRGLDGQNVSGKVFPAHPSVMVRCPWWTQAFREPILVVLRTPTISACLADYRTAKCQLAPVALNPPQR